MKTYLVGGAVRDQLLGRKVTDRDWVVVGATPEQMTQAGYKPVGKDFPVFIEPKSGEEYALARTERKTAKGYQGFSFNTSTEITLEEDLSRRDLTINAMAQDDNGDIIDPFNGQEDMKNGLLRHVSDAFVEDPVRILRVARFAAKFDFRIADETMQLMKIMVNNGEVDALVPERVWTEMHKALLTEKPSKFIETLRECGALAKVLPEIDNLFGVPQPPEHHPEIDTGIHTLMALQYACKLSNDPLVRFGALVHDLGKAVTPKAELPHHYGHEKSGVPLVKQLCERIRTPKKYLELGCIISEFHLHMHKMKELKNSTVLKMLERTGSLRDAERAKHFALVCESDARGRTGLQDRDYPQPELFFKFLNAANSVDTGEIAKSVEPGENAGLKIKEAIRTARITAIGKVNRE